MSSQPDSPTSETARQNADRAALACYLSAVVAIGNCVAEVFPPAGTMYRDRLLKLPRRLGFDATPAALQQSREAVETDLVEFAAAAGAWIGAGLRRAEQIRDRLHASEEMWSAAAELQQAFLDDLAEHLETSAEVDEEAQLRRSFHRYAAGLRAYSRRTNTERLAAIDDLRRRQGEIDSWLAEAAVSDFVDPETGLMNRVAAERRIETEIGKQIPFCTVLVESTGEGESGQIMKHLADRLAATVRPYDVIFRWSEHQLMTVFEAPESDITARVSQIAGWLHDGTLATGVSLVEHGVGRIGKESTAALIERIESAGRQVPASSR
jgi:GGDEF domain-containing protein